MSGKRTAEMRAGEPRWAARSDNIFNRRNRISFSITYIGMSNSTELEISDDTIERGYRVAKANDVTATVIAIVAVVIELLR